MSGPKSSNYRILNEERRRQEAIRRRHLEEEMEAERKRREEKARNELDKNIADKKIELSDLVTEFNDNIKGTVSEAEKLLPGNPISESLKEILANIMINYHQIPTSYSQRDSLNMQNYLNRLQAAYQSIQVQNNGIIKEYLTRLAKEVREKKQFNAEMEFLTKSSDFKKEQAKRYNLQCPQPSKGENNETKAKLDQEYNKLLELLDFYLHNEYLVSNSIEVEDFKNATEKIYKDKSLDLRYRIEALTSRLSTFKGTKNKYDKEISTNTILKNEFDMLHIEYLSLCNILEEEPQLFELNFQDCHEIINNLKKEMERQALRLKKKDESNYVIQSINEVMQELGYELLGSEIMENSRMSTQHDIYEFDGGNVINIYTADDSSVLFEVTGVKEDNQELTKIQKVKIKEGMEKFCSQYDVILQKLKDRDIQFEYQSLKEPDIKYARAISLDNVIGERKIMKENVRTPSHRGKVKQINN